MVLGRGEWAVISKMIQDPLRWGLEVALVSDSVPLWTLEGQLLSGGRTKDDSLTALGFMHE